MNIKTVNNNIVKIFMPICEVDAITTYLNYFGVKYKNTFCNTWRFEYNNFNQNNIPLSEKFSCGYDFVKNIYDYCGVKCKTKKINSLEEGLNILSQSFEEDKPVIIHLDTFYINWSTYFGEIHTNHVVLAIGLDTTKNVIYIIDNEFFDNRASDKIFEISYEIFRQASKFYYNITMEEREPVNSVRLLKKELLNSSKYIGDKSLFNNIRDFAEDFKQNFEPNNEFKDYDKNVNLNESILLRKIRIVMAGRNLVMLFLKSLNLYNEMELELVFDILKVAISKWNIFINLMLKYECMGWKKRINEKAYNIINDIADLEELAYKKLISIVLDDNKLSISHTNESITKNYQGCVYLNLEIFFNNKSFGEGKYIKGANLTGLGEFLMLENIPSNNILKIENIVYKFPLLNEKDNDNISCCGQVISLPQVKFSRICLLACAEWGSYYYETIVLNYHDSKMEYLNIRIPDISMEPFNEEKIAWSGRTATIDNGEITIIQPNAKIFSLSYPIDNENIIDSITLPNCPNIHIYAISLV